MSQQVPVHCPNCDQIFASRAYSITGASGITFVNCKESCIFCGHMATVADGTYDARAGIVEFLSGPERSRELLDRLGELTTQILRGDKSAGQVISEAHQESNELGEIAESLFSDKNSFGFNALLLLLFLILSRTSINLDIDVNDIIRQATESTPQQIYQRYQEVSRPDTARDSVDQENESGSVEPGSEVGGDNIRA